VSVSFPPKTSHPWYQLNNFLEFKKRFRVIPNELYEKVVISSDYN
jgi:hypothetical protein